MAKDSRFNGRTVEEMRVYAPNNGSLAYKTDYLYDTRLAAAQPKRRQETAAPAETQPKIRPQKTRIPLSVTLRERICFICIKIIKKIGTFDSRKCWCAMLDYSVFYHEWYPLLFF